MRQELRRRTPSQDGQARLQKRAALQGKFGLHKDRPAPVVAMVTRLVGHKGVDLVQAICRRPCCQQRPRSWSSSAPAKAGLRELLQRAVRPAIRAASGRQHRHSTPSLAQRDLLRRGHVPDAVPLRALRSGPDGGAAATAPSPSSARPAACGTPSTIPATAAATASPSASYNAHDMLNAACWRAKAGLLADPDGWPRAGPPRHGVRFQLVQLRQELRGSVQRSCEPLVTIS